MRKKTTSITVERELPNIFTYKEICVYNPDKKKVSMVERLGRNWVTSEDARKLAKAFAEAADKADGLI